MQSDSPPRDDPSSSFVAQPGLVLPTPTMQNQIHELAKTLPPPRKQNTACDACRARKVKCHRVPGQDKCQHCSSKNYPCTHYVQQATSERKRSSTTTRRPRNLSSPNPNPSSPGSVKLPSPSVENDSPPPPQVPQHLQPVPLLVKYGFYPLITLNTPTREVLGYLFSPPENVNESLPFARIISPYAAWGDQALKLEDDKFRAEFALDLVEVFFQIVHTRLPLLNPAQFRNRLHLHPSSPPNPNEMPLHPALVATVIAWGTKFSEHPLLVADRSRPGANGQSIIAKTLVDRARDLAEALKVHRIPTPDHVVIGLLIEPLQSQNPEDPNGFHTFWLRASTRHLLDLQINHKSVTSTIKDPEARGTMIFAWWMACICDAYGSAYYRHIPMLDDDDYDMDFYIVDPVSPDAPNGGPMTPSPREQLEGYYRAAHSLARTSRQMSRQLWRPVTEADGVSIEVLTIFTDALTAWKDEYLNAVGVPKNFEGEWDFVSAVSSCASDATYHIMWIILFNALDDFGIKEINEVVRIGNPPSMAANFAKIDAVKRLVAEEALHGALRIAGLAGVLTSNGYLRLDPAVMHISTIQAGTLLARLGRPEVSNCTAGLEQYSYSYEEAGEHAREMRRLYDRCLAGDLEFNHMASVAPRVVISPPPVPVDHAAMMVDEPMQGVSAGRVQHSSPTSDAFLHGMYVR